jgi:UDP-2-acetamido-2-deoxy-ribo-hexuluronate aminotransferase
MDKIVMVDLRGQYARIKPEIETAIQNVLDASSFIQGPAVREFEASFSKLHEGAHTVSCGNGTDALQIAMMALGFKPGDEIILPVFTYVATAEVIALLGLAPVFVDVDERTFAIDVSQVEAKITGKTVGIVPVHLFGQQAPMEPLLNIARNHNLHIVEDFAQSIGAQYKFPDGRSALAGTMGTVGATSFFPSKNLGCYGDGGALITPDPDLADRMRMIANHGQRIRYYHDVIGVNSRLDTLQAAILNVKLKYLQDYEQKRKSVADRYDRELADLPFLKIPYRASYSTHVFHQYTVKVNPALRDHFKKYLEEKGIPSTIYYPVSLHQQKAFQVPGIGKGAFPVSEDLSRQVLSLPIHTEMSEEQLSYICRIIRQYPGA